MIKAYPMNNPTVPSYERFSLTLGPDAICHIQLYLPLSGALAEQITAEVEQLLREHPHVRGLLLDMRESIPLSIVRLGELLERLGALNLPVAVLFSAPHHQETATLLHNTLVRRRYVAYFTDLDQAHAYLLHPPNGNGSPHAEDAP